MIIIIIVTITITLIIGLNYVIILNELILVVKNAIDYQLIILNFLLIFILLPQLNLMLIHFNSSLKNHFISPILHN